MTEVVDLSAIRIARAESATVEQAHQERPLTIGEMFTINAGVLLTHNSVIFDLLARIEALEKASVEARVAASPVLTEE